MSSSIDDQFSPFYTYNFSNMSFENITKFSVDYTTKPYPKVSISFTSMGVVTTYNTLYANKIILSDGYLIYDIHNTVENSEVYRLYQAAFARIPDEGGFRYWVDQHNTNNQSLSSISYQFIASTEFKTKYGSNPTNAQLIDLLYQNVLGRAGEAGGVSYWNNELNTGHQTKDQVLLGFAESSENISRTAAHIDNGYWFV